MASLAGMCVPGGLSSLKAVRMNWYHVGLALGSRLGGSEVLKSLQPNSGCPCKFSSFQRQAAWAEDLAVTSPTWVPLSKAFPALSLPLTCNGLWSDRSLLTHLA